MSLRIDILNALLAQVTAAGFFADSGRRVKWFNEITEFPAVYVRKIGEHQRREAMGQPAIRTIKAEVIVYTATPDADGIPSDALQLAIDSVEASLEPSPGQAALTLGGLVQRCWIEGNIEEEPGDARGQAVAIIPVNIVIP